jgi:hypothetical protein
VEDAVAIQGRVILEPGARVSGKDVLRGFIEDALDEDMRCHIIDENEKDS